MAWAVLDHDGTPWMYMADGNDYPGNGSVNSPPTNETIDGDGTKINGMAYYGGGADQNLDDPALKWDLNTPSSGIISYDLTNGPSGYGFFSRGNLWAEGFANPQDWTANTGFTTEWRVGSDFPSNSNGHIQVIIQAGTVFGQGYIFGLDIADNPTIGDGYHQVVDTYAGEPIEVPFDTRDGSMHTYRVVLEPVGVDGVDDPSTVFADLYIDDLFTAQLTGISNGGTARFDFGRIKGNSYVPGGNTIDADWDFFRIHPGATAPELTEPQWLVNASGDWNVASNWFGGIPNGIDAEANFLGQISAARTVFTDTPKTVGIVRFDNANSYLITGQGSLTLEVSSGTAEINVAQGTHKINLPLTFASDTDINVTSGVLKISDPVTINANVDVTQTGTVIYESTVSTDAGASIEFGNASHIAALTMAAGSSATLTSAANSALMVDSLSLNSTASIDIKTNDLIVNGDNYSTIEGKVIQGFNGGNWLGDGISSSSAATDTNFVTSVGVADNAEVGYSTFSGHDLTGDEILVKHTYVGDANLTGGVNLDDFNQFLFGFNPANAAPQIWLNGDFNYSGSVNLDDFNLFLFGLANQGGTLVSPELFIALSEFAGAEGVDVDLSTVPEPAGLGTLAVGTASLLRRRARRSRNTSQRVQL